MINASSTFEETQKEYPDKTISEACILIERPLQASLSLPFNPESRAKTVSSHLRLTQCSIASDNVLLQALLEQWGEEEAGRLYKEVHTRILTSEESPERMAVK